MRKRNILLIAAATLVMVAALGGLMALYLVSDSSSPSGPSATTTATVAPAPLRKGVASYEAPFRAGDPEAKDSGLSFQVLTPEHPPVHAKEIYWLGETVDGDVPYVKAYNPDLMAPHPELSSLVYASRETVDRVSVIIQTYKPKRFISTYYLGEAKRLKLPQHPLKDGFGVFLPKEPNTIIAFLKRATVRINVIAPPGTDVPKERLIELANQARPWQFPGS